MQANLRETATGYRVGFARDTGEDPYLTLDLDYLDQMRYGVLTTVTVSTSIQTSQRFPDGVILIDRINLMKGRDLKEIAYRIDQVITPPKSAARMDWLRHLEHAAVLVNDQLLMPVEAIDLTERTRSDRPRFDIDGLLAHHKSNILFGPGGTGKSVLSLRIAGGLQMGGTVFGLPVMEKGTTLYLDWEDDADTMVERLDKVSAGMGMDHRFPIQYKSLHGKGPYERHHADVKHFLSTRPDIKLVIFDSTAMAMHGSSQGDGADGAIKFFSLVGQLPVTRLLIDHVSSDDLKADDKKGPPRKPYGSVFKGNAARNMWSVTPWNANYLSGVTLTHAKTNVSAKQPDIEVAVEWRDDHVSFTKL